MADAAIATPVFLLIVFGALELLILSWKALSVQLLANDAARLYATWYGCSDLAVQTCQPDNKWFFVYQAVTAVYVGSDKGVIRDSYPQGLDSRYGLAMSPANTTLTFNKLAPYNQTNTCGLATMPGGSYEGEGDLVSVTIDYKEVPFLLNLLNFRLYGKASAAVERRTVF